MLRRSVKAGLARILHHTGGDRWVERLAARPPAPKIVAYHRVVESYAESAETSLPAMLTSRCMLKRHLDWIAPRYRFVSLSEIGETASGARRCEAIAVTFDDGYRDFYHNAFPLLKEKGIPAAVFVVTDLVGTRRLQVHDLLFLLLRQAIARWSTPEREIERLLFGLDVRWAPKSLVVLRSGSAALTPLLLRSLSQEEVGRLVDRLREDFEVREGEKEELLPLTWDMVVEMHRAGVTVGSHTRSHAWLPREAPEVVRREAEGSRQEIERRLGAPVEDFAYPDGQFDAGTVGAIAAAGYRRGYTACRHRDPGFPALTLPRTALWEHACLDSRRNFSPAVLACQLHGVFQLAAGCPRRHE